MCRCLEFKLNASRTRCCLCISTRADCVHRVHGLTIYAHPCSRHCRRRHRHLWSRGCHPRLLFQLFSCFPFFFYMAHCAISFVAVAEHDRWWFSPAAFPRFGPRISSQWMETADYLCAMFGGSRCISLCATLIRKMNDLSGSRAYTATLVKRFVRFRFIANDLKRSHLRTFGDVNTQWNMQTLWWICNYYIREMAQLLFPQCNDSIDCDDVTTRKTHWKIIEKRYGKHKTDTLNTA